MSRHIAEVLEDDRVLFMKLSRKTCPALATAASTTAATAPTPSIALSQRERECLIAPPLMDMNPRRMRGSLDEARFVSIRTQVLRPPRGVVRAPRPSAKRAWQKALPAVPTGAAGPRGAKCRSARSGRR
jgi:hypothetical protein